MNPKSEYTWSKKCHPHNYNMICHRSDFPVALRFLNGAVLKNLNMYSSQKLYPVCSATWLSDALKPKKNSNLTYKRDLLAQL